MGGGVTNDTFGYFVSSDVVLPERRSEGDGAIATSTERRPEDTYWERNEGRSTPKGTPTEWSDP